MTAEDKQKSDTTPAASPVQDEECFEEKVLEVEPWEQEISVNLSQVISVMIESNILSSDSQEQMSTEPTAKQVAILMETLQGVEEDKLNIVLEVLSSHGMDATLAKLAIQQDNAEDASEDHTSAIEEPPARPYKKVIEECSGTLIDCVNPSPRLLRHLQFNSVLNNDMMLKVQCRPNRQDKVRVLLGFLKTLGPSSLQTFIDALHATDQKYLANILAANNFT